MRKLVLLFLIVISLMLACSLPGKDSQPSAQVSPVVPPTDGSVATAIPPVDEGDGLNPVDQPVDQPIADLPPTPTSIPSAPVSIQEGLTSLNSYLFIMETTSYTNTATDKTIVRLETQKTQDQDARMTRYAITSPVPGQEPEQTETYLYTIGNEQCSGSDENDWTYDSISAQEKEMQEFLSGMVDLLPIIDDPVFVGTDTTNGVPTNHFTFQVSGLGAESGTDVVANQGEYWVAQDGQYLVHYTLVLETRDPNTQDVVHVEILIDLSSINQPITIAFPQGCLDAKNNP